MLATSERLILDWGSGGALATALGSASWAGLEHPVELGEPLRRDRIMLWPGEQAETSPGVHEGPAEGDRTL